LDVFELQTILNIDLSSIKISNMVKKNTSCPCGPSILDASEQLPGKTAAETLLLHLIAKYICELDEYKPNKYPTPVYHDVFVEHAFEILCGEHDNLTYPIYITGTVDWMITPLKGMPIIGLYNSTAETLIRYLGLLQKSLPVPKVVFGFVTNFWTWIFVRITEEGIITCSNSHEFGGTDFGAIWASFELFLNSFKVANPQLGTSYGWQPPNFEFSEEWPTPEGRRLTPEAELKAARELIGMGE
jgi:hypothetical protein